MWHANRLTASQALLVGSWISSPELVEDLSWNLVDTSVLHLRSEQGDFIVKAAGAANHHIGREITAHESATAPLVEQGAATRLLWANRDANVLVTEYLPGNLVEGTNSELEPSTYEQAGRLLRALHDGEGRLDPDSERRSTDRAIAWLDSEHRIAPREELAARRILGAYRPEPVVVVPTHGDWQPRNWLDDHGRIKVIDFGRFEYRPAESDLCRLAAQQWREDSSLEAAYFEGYGSDPRNDVRWPMMMLREAIGTAAWAYQVKNREFEAQGHRMLAEALASYR